MYIVSGLERSGTSLMMQILENACLNVCYDFSRKPDVHNPNGYYELFDGKIIYELLNEKFDEDIYDDKIIKITAYGLHMLKETNHKVIYMIRDLDEVIDSQEKMINNRIYKDRNNVYDLLNKLNNETIDLLRKNNIQHVIIDYNAMINNPKKELRKLGDFLGKDVTHCYHVIDKSLYRNRNTK
jgi:hypothetical protein